MLLGVALILIEQKVAGYMVIGLVISFGGGPVLFSLRELCRGIGSNQND